MIPGWMDVRRYAQKHRSNHFLEKLPHFVLSIHKSTLTGAQGGREREEERERERDFMYRRDGDQLNNSYKLYFYHSINM